MRIPGLNKNRSQKSRPDKVWRRGSESNQTRILKTDKLLILNTTKKPRIPTCALWKHRLAQNLLTCADAGFTISAVMKPLCALALCCFALSAAAQTTLKLKIDANLSNQERLLRALNAAGKSKIAFSLADNNYDYRIAFETTTTSRDLVTGSNGNVNGVTMEYPTGNAIVYNGRDQELFRFSHEAFRSEGSAINGTAKQIVHRLQKWRAEHPN